MEDKLYMILRHGDDDWDHKYAPDIYLITAKDRDEAVRRAEINFPGELNCLRIKMIVLKEWEAVCIGRLSKEYIIESGNYV